MRKRGRNGANSECRCGPGDLKTRLISPFHSIRRYTNRRRVSFTPDQIG
ncbi:hypothetical protein RBWH47_02785 [Rhodopirellula baltica WH47]|uniref:Uncharacterized protein n=1 Tax=Rhodopirellula baltica WH47 TaxID=991778 RepID=F2AYH9_RHOBT|nr:hypothetical protein RBWH47_02785 [Rhodopirellula baltica WH47]